MLAVLTVMLVLVRPKYRQKASRLFAMLSDFFRWMFDNEFLNNNSCLLRRGLTMLYESLVAAYLRTSAEEISRQRDVGRFSR